MSASQFPQALRGNPLASAREAGRPTSDLYSPSLSHIQPPSVIPSSVADYRADCGLSSLSAPIPRGLSRSWWNPGFPQCARLSHFHCKCYSSEGRGFPNASVTALKGKESWKSGARNTTVTPYVKPHTHKRFIGKDARRVLPLLWEKQLRIELNSGFI